MLDFVATVFAKTCLHILSIAANRDFLTSQQTPTAEAPNSHQRIGERSEPGAFSTTHRANVP
jgi:hypothetical protein